MKYKSLLVISLVVTVLLTGAIFYPGALTKPYNGTHYIEYDHVSYSVAHESTEDFNESMREKSLNTETAIPVEKLSESQQRAFQEAKDQPQEYRDSPSGRQYLDIRLCDPALILCNEYRELPNPSSSGSEHTLIEDSDGELYLVEARSFYEAGANWDGIERIFEIVARFLILTPYALFLAYRAWTFSPPDPTRTSVGYGATLLAIVLGYPYLLMFTDISFPSWHIPALIVITWCVILIEVWRGRNGTQAESG